MSDLKQQQDDADVENAFYDLFKRYSEQDAERALDNLLITTIGFCGCGHSVDAREVIRKLLQAVFDHQQRNDAETEFSIARGSAEQMWNEMKSAVTDNPDGAVYALLYWLNHAGLLEHGGSVPGWIDESGIKVLKMLQIEEARNE